MKQSNVWILSLVLILCVVAIGFAFAASVWLNEDALLGRASQSTPGTSPRLPLRESGSPDSTIDPLTLLVEKLILGQQFLRSTPGYRAEVTLQERIDNELGDPQTLLVKCRHDPFSLYMEWIAGPSGRELIYVEGRNDDRVLVHSEGLRGRLLPKVALKMDSSLIMSKQRYPVDEFGLLFLTEKLYKIVSVRHPSPSALQCSHDGEATFGDRIVDRYTVEHASPEAHELYRKAVVLIDQELSIPTSLTCYAWSASRATNEDSIDEDTLIEIYQYRNVTFEDPPEDLDFDPTNPDYAFER